MITSLVYRNSAGCPVELDVDGDTMWATQAQIAELFEVDQRTVSHHVNSIFEGEELERTSTQKVGKSSGGRAPTTYSLDMIVSVGYRVNSKKATEFRKWATKHLVSIMTTGVSVEKSLLNEKAAPILAGAQEKLRELRWRTGTSGREVLKSVARLVDWTGNEGQGPKLCALIWNKIHVATHGMTAPEIIYKRSDRDKDNAGLVTFTGKHGPQMQEVEVACNYQTYEELSKMERIVAFLLLHFEDLEASGHKMKVEDRAAEVDRVLKWRGLKTTDGWSTVPPVKAYRKARQELSIHRNRKKNSNLKNMTIIS